MNFFERIINKAEVLANPEQHRFDVIQETQMKLIERAGGDDIAGTWIDANNAMFRQLIDDTRFDYINRLDDEDTHDDTLREIESKLTPLNTIH